MRQNETLKTKIQFSKISRFNTVFSFWSMVRSYECSFRISLIIQTNYFCIYQIYELKFFSLIRVKLKVFFIIKWYTFDVRLWNANQIWNSWNQKQKEHHTMLLCRLRQMMLPNERKKIQPSFIRSDFLSTSFGSFLRYSVPSFVFHIFKTSHIHIVHSLSTTPSPFPP